MSQVTAGNGLTLWMLVKPTFSVTQELLDLNATICLGRYDATNVEGGMEAWASAGYETAEHRADIRVSGGVGSFRIS